MHNIFRNLTRYNKSDFNQPLKFMLIISGAFTFAFGMFSPIYALFVEGIGGNVTTAANAWAVFSLSAGVLTFAAGRWENKLKETEMGIILSQFIIASAYLVYCFTDRIWMLYAAQALLGAGMAFYWTAFHSVYGSHVEKRKATAQWGWYDGLAYLIPAVAAVIGGFLVELYGFGVIFIIMATVSFLCGIFIWALPRKVL